MTIIVFLVDTSASMQQKAVVSGHPSSLLDIAKGAVEFFVKLRQKSSLESRGDRYMLFTFEEYPFNIKAGWKENLQTFMTELKNLQSHGLTTMGTALKHVLDTLNVNRIQTGIDMYGQGRYPYYLEPAVIITITDGGRLFSPVNGGQIAHELTLPMTDAVPHNRPHFACPGSELTREPFRWDQRLYTLVLRMGGLTANNMLNNGSSANLIQQPNPVTGTGCDGGHVASDFSPIDLMCEVTGGRSYAVTSQRVLHQCVDSLVQKLQSGVVIHFEKFGSSTSSLITSSSEEGHIGMSNTGHSTSNSIDNITPQHCEFGLANAIPPITASPTPTANNAPSAPPAWHSCRKMIYVPRSAQKAFAVGFWPLPEAFVPDPNAQSLPPRSAHPRVLFSTVHAEPMMIDNLPFDKYELEPSPLTLHILARKTPNSCWQVHIASNNACSSIGATVGGVVGSHHPFGYLKASTNLLTVNLFVLPYNYPVLLPLLDDLFKVHRLKADREWRITFNNYLRTMPPYYAAPLRRAMIRMGAGNLVSSLIPETIDSSCLSYQVLNYLKRLKSQAKVEYDKMLSASSTGSIGGSNVQFVGGYHHPGPPLVSSNNVGFAKVVQRTAYRKDDTDLLILNPTMRDRLSDRSNSSASNEPKLKHLTTASRILCDQLCGNMSNNLSIPISRGVKKEVRFASKAHVLGLNVARNAFDIHRTLLLDELARMRASYLHPTTYLKNNERLHSDDIDAVYAKHSLPIAQMSDYQDYLRRQPIPLRSIEAVPVRQHMFGNPFKINKDMILDEVVNDEMLGCDQQQQQQPSLPLKASNASKRSADSPSLLLALPSKRQKKGPLPKDYVYRPKSPVVGHCSEANNETTLSINGNAEAILQSEEKNSLNNEMNVRHKYNIEITNDRISQLNETVDTENFKSAQFEGGNVNEVKEEADIRSTVKASRTTLNFTENSTSDGLDSREKYIANSIRNILHDTTQTSDFDSFSNDTAESKNVDECFLSHSSILEDVESHSCDLSDEEMRSVHVRNANLKHLIFKEVKRPGKDYSRLFSMLKNQLKGPPSVRKSYVRHWVISEAKRFKRKLLAQLLESKLDELTTVK